MPSVNCQEIKNVQSIRELRLRMGWSTGDLARRLHVETDFIQNVEAGDQNLTSDFWNELEILFHQADMCSLEVLNAPQAEQAMDQAALDQVEFSRVQEQFE